MYEERSVTRRTALPLVAVAATFVLPMTDACNHTVSPLTYVVESTLTSALWILPTFVAAAVLAAAVFRSWRAKAKTALAFVATSALALTLPVFAVLFAKDSAHFLAPTYGLAAIATALLLWRARREAGWRRLSGLLDAYAAAAMPLAVVIATLAKYSGAYVFVVAYVAFATQRALVFLQERPARASVARVRVAVPTRVAGGLAELEEEAEHDEDALNVKRARRIV